MDQITPRPGYFTTHMIEYVRKVLPSYKDKSSIEQIRNTLDQYRDAIKFILPYDGVLFDDTDMTHYVQFLRLPFPRVVLEYSGTTGKFKEPKSKEVQVTILAVEGTTSSNIRGVRINCAYKAAWLDDTWMLLPSSIFLPEGITAQEIMSKGVSVLADDEEALEGIYQRLSKGSVKDVAEAAGKAILREALSVFQFCAACACGNVKYQDIKAPKFINQKRQASGKLPLFEYKVLTVDIKSHTEHGEAKGGTHASPREHLRRGHIRRYQSGLTIWVNSMVVGHRELGRIKKDYRVKGDNMYGPPKEQP